MSTFRNCARKRVTALVRGAAGRRLGPWVARRAAAAALLRPAAVVDSARRIAALSWACQATVRSACSLARVFMQSGGLATVSILARNAGRAAYANADTAAPARTVEHRLPFFLRHRIEDLLRLRRRQRGGLLLRWRCPTAAARTASHWSIGIAASTSVTPTNAASSAASSVPCAAAVARIAPQSSACAASPA